VDTFSITCRTSVASRRAGAEDSPSTGTAHPDAETLSTITCRTTVVSLAASHTRREK
jgi:hypothetical protein